MPTIIIRSLPGRLGFVVVAVMAAVGVVASGSFRPPAPGTVEAAAEGGSSGRRIG